jgi:hypothetical protein
VHMRCMLTRSALTCFDISLLMHCLLLNGIEVQVMLVTAFVVIPCCYECRGMSCRSSMTSKRVMALRNSQASLHGAPRNSYCGHQLLQSKSDMRTLRCCSRLRITVYELVVVSSASSKDKELWLQPLLPAKWASRPPRPRAQARRMYLPM